jgi:hypothetical protein
MRRLDADDALYERLLEKQRQALHHLFFETPVESLRNCLNIKRQMKPRRYSLWDKLGDLLYLKGCDVYNFLKEKKRWLKSLKKNK